MANSKYEIYEARKNYGSTWSTDLMHAPVRDCPTCCLSALCPPCMSFWLRKKALRGDMSRYECCGGYMPCSGKCGEKNCPSFCLCLEACLCFGSSVASTRFLLQDEYNIKNTKCDNCIIGFMLCLSQLACIFRLVAMFTEVDGIDDAADALTLASDLVYCTVCACMQTQHNVEMKEKQVGDAEGSQIVPPNMQHMSRGAPGYGAPPVEQPYAAPDPGNAQPYPAQPYPAQPYPAVGMPQGYPAQSYGPPPPGLPQGYPQGYPAPQQQAMFDGRPNYGS